MTDSLGSRAGATRRGITLDQVWLIAAVAFVAVRVFLSPVPPNDFWWHMATGRVIAESGQIPQVDVFSWTRAGEPFYNQSWLAQLILYGLFQAGGLPLIILVQALVLSTAYGLLVHLCAIRSASPRLSAGIFMLATLPASFNNWVVRPQSYAIPLFILSLYLLTRWRFAERGSPWGRLAPLLALPAAGLIWVNLHGSFVLGGALIALTFAGEVARRFLEHRAEARTRLSRPLGAPADVLSRSERPWRPPLWHLLVAGGLTGLAWLANPGGLQVLGYVRNLLSSSQVTTLVTEWAAPTVRESGGAIFFGFLIALVVVLAYAGRAPDLVDMLLCGVFLWLALGAVRNNIWFVAVATPLFAVQAAAWLHPVDAPRRPAFQGLPALNAALVGVFGLALLVTLPWIKPALDLPPSVGALADEGTPIAAVEALRADPDRPERLFHDMAYGSYLIWAAPEQKVWSDPRIELYPFEQWRDYQRLAAGSELELLDRYRIDGLLLDNDAQESLVAWAKEQPQRWELRYADEQASYFVRVP